MNAKELAEKLNGVKDGEISQELINQAKENGLVIVYGASDDLIEFEGAIRDEGGCYDGGEFLIDSKGIFSSMEDEIMYEEYEKVKEYVNRRESSKLIEAIWNEEDGYSWTYKTDIPHECFDMLYSDGDLYCRGIIFDIKELEVFRPNIEKALSEAVSALYFNDNSDYATALWQVVENLGGKEAVELLEKDGSEAFQQYYIK